MAAKPSLAMGKGRWNATDLSMCLLIRPWGTLTSNKKNGVGGSAGPFLPIIHKAGRPISSVQIFLFIFH